MSKIEPLQCIHLEQPIEFDTGSVIRKMAAQVADMADTVIYQTIVAAAKEEGITDLYILDKQFVLSALREKLERENPKPLSSAIQSIQAERRKQDEKWGDQSGNHPFEWMSILGEEYGELCEAVNETYFGNAAHPERGGAEKIRGEAVQVAAVAVALIEAIDRTSGTNRSEGG